MFKILGLLSKELQVSISFFTGKWLSIEYKYFCFAICLYILTRHLYGM